MFLFCTDLALGRSDAFFNLLIYLTDFLKSYILKKELVSIGIDTSSGGCFLSLLFTLRVRKVFVMSSVATVFNKVNPSNIGGSLGIHTKSLDGADFSCSFPSDLSPDINPVRVPRSSDVAISRLERWALLAVSREILRSFHRLDKKNQLQKRFRVVQCMRLPIENDVQVMSRNKVAHYAGLNSCGSVWSCPVCASKISERRRVELRGAMDFWQSQGGSVLMCTTTIPHVLKSPLVDVLGDLQVARNKWRDRVAWKRCKVDFGIVGTVRALEVTVGKNGWHPHVHELFFLDRSYSSTQFKKLKVSLFVQWLSALESCGYPNANFAALDLQDGSFAQDYISKWGMDAELTKQSVKRSVRGFSPFDLLRAVYQDGDISGNSAASYFVEYAFAFLGKRQLYWSKNLKNLLHVADKSDDEICEEIENGSDLLGSLTLSQWHQILQYDVRGEFLEYVNLGGFRCALDYLLDLQIKRDGYLPK